MNTFDFITVPIIVSVVYGGITLLKKAVNNNEKVLQFIPIIAAIMGAALGVIAFFAMPEIMPASNAFVSIIVGGASGLAATGSHQIIKQLTKKDESDSADTNKDDKDAENNDG